MRKTAIITSIILIFYVLPAHSPCFSDELPRLTQEGRAKLEELKKKEDLTGIIRLFETECSEEGLWPNHVMSSTHLSRALLSFPREKFIPAMLEGMKSRNQYVSRSCLDTLAELKDRRALEYVIGKIMPPRLSEKQRERALHIAKDLGHDDYEKRKAAEEELISMGPSVGEIVRPLTRHNDPQVAYSARKIIAEACPPLSITDPDVLKRFKGPAALQALRVLVKRQGYPEHVVHGALWVLGENGTAENADVIRPYLEEKYVKAAIAGLGNLKDTKCVPDLIKLIGDPEVGDWAIRALGKIGDRRAVEPLKKAMTTSTDKDMVRYCKCALLRLSDRKELHRVIESASGRELHDLWETVAELAGPEEIETVLARLPGLNFRRYPGTGMIEWLGDTAPRGDKRVIGVVKAIRDSHKSLASNERVSLALIKLGDEEEEKAVLARTRDKDPVTRHNALQLLGQVKDERFLPLFIEFLEDKEEFVHPWSGVGFKQRVRGAAIGAIYLYSGEPFYLWPSDYGLGDQWHSTADRQVREIKAWWQKYQEQKAAEGE